MSYRSIYDAGDVAAPLLPKPKGKKPIPRPVTTARVYDPTPKEAGRPLKFPTKAEMKAYSERAKALKDISDDYQRLMSAGEWESIKETDWDYYNSVNVLIQRGSINPYTGPVQPRGMPPVPNPGMGELRRSDRNMSNYDRMAETLGRDPLTPPELDLAEIASGVLETGPSVVAANAVMRGVAALPHPAAKFAAPVLGIIAGIIARETQKGAGRLAMGEKGTAEYEQVRAEQRAAHLRENLIGENLPAAIAFRPSTTATEAAMGGGLGYGLGVAGQAYQNIVSPPERQRPIDYVKPIVPALVNATFSGQMRGGTVGVGRPPLVQPPRPTAVMGRVGPAKALPKPTAPPAKTGIKDPLPYLPPIGVKVAPAPVLGPESIPETLGPPAPLNRVVSAPTPKPPAAKESAKVVQQPRSETPVAKPVETPTTPAKPPTKENSLETYAQNLVKKHGVDGDLPSWRVIAKELGITRDEALDVMERAVVIRQTPKVKTPRGKANTPTTPVETPTSAPKPVEPEAKPAPAPEPVAKSDPAMEKLKAVSDALKAKIEAEAVAKNPPTVEAKSAPVSEPAVKPVEPPPAAPKAQPDTPEGKAQAYVDSLRAMPNVRMGPKPFAQRYLDWKRGGMKGERPSAGAEGITPAAVRSIEKKIDAHMGDTPKPSTAPTKPGELKNPPARQSARVQRSPIAGTLGARLPRQRGGFVINLGKGGRTPKKPDVDESLIAKDDAEKSNVSRTSVRQIPALHRQVGWESGKVNVDLGGGKYDNATDYLREERGVENVVVDKYSRDEAHNTKALARVKEVGGGDTGTIANVLNVVENPAIRKQILQQARSLVKPGGKVRISVYEGDAKGVGRATSAGTWQNNRKLGDYLAEVKSVYPDAKIVGGRYIEATNPQRPKSVEQMRRGSESGWFGRKPGIKNTDPSPINRESKPNLAQRIIRQILDPQYTGPTPLAMLKQGFRSDAAIPVEAANIMAKRQGINRKETAFAAEGGLNPGDRVEEGIRRTRQLRDVFEDVTEHGFRDEKDKPIGTIGGLRDVVKPITEHPSKMGPDQMMQAYKDAETVSAARAVLARGKRLDDIAADEYADAVADAKKASFKAKTAKEKKAAAAQTADLANVKAGIDAKLIEQKNNILGYRAKKPTETDIEEAQRQMDDIKKKNPTTFDAMLKVGDNMREFALNGLKYAVAHGRLSQAEFDRITNSVKDYVPLRQLADDIEYRAPAGSGGKKPLGVPAAVAKRFSYGDKEGVIESPLTEIISQTERIVREVNRNNVMQSFYELASGPNDVSDIVEIIPGNKIPRNGEIPNKDAMKAQGIMPVWVNGEQKYMKFSTRGPMGISLARVVSEVGRSNDVLSQSILHYLNAATSVQKRLATSTPAFVQAQIVRDRGDRAYLSQHIGGPAKNPAEALLNELRYNLTPPDAAQLSREKRFPMGQTWRTVLDEAWDYDQIQQNILRDAGIAKPGMVHKIKTPVRLIEKAMSSGERNNRRAEFRASYEFAKSKGLDDRQAGLYASSQATKLQDFTEKGTVARYIIDPLIPFYSAAIEGMSRKAGAMNPIYRDKKQLIKAGATAFALGAVPAFTLMQQREKNGTMKDWTEYPAAQTAMGFIASTQKILNNTVEWIPKPHAIAELSAAVELGYQWDWATKRSGMNPTELANYKKRLIKRGIETFGLLNSPLDAEAVLENGFLGILAQTKFNENAYTEKEIIPQDEKQVPVSQRPGREGKTPLSAKAAQIINRGRKPENLVDIRPAEFIFERFLGRWASGAEALSRAHMDPDSKRKALDMQSFWRTLTPFEKDEPGPFSTSVVELEKGVKAATPVNPTPAQRIIAGELGLAEPKRFTKSRLIGAREKYYNATTNKETSDAARNLRGIAAQRFKPGLTKMSTEPMLPARKGEVIPTRKEQRRLANPPRK